MITLTSGGTAVRVDADAGGRIAGWEVDGRQLLVTSGPDALRWGCYPLVPWAGRVRDGRFAVDGREVALTLTEGEPHALHGVGYHQPWAVRERTPTMVRLALDLAGEASRAAGWPFGGAVEQVVTVVPAGVSVTLAVRAGAQALPLVVGWHPWFVRALDGADGPGVEGRVLLAADGMYVRGPDGLPIGEVGPQGPGPWDDCFTGLREVPAVRWPGVGEVRVTSDLDHVVVFDAGPLGICVEPQSGPPDAYNLDAHRTLAPGEAMTASMRLDWTVRGW